MTGNNNTKITIVHACQWEVFKNGVRLTLEKRENLEFIGDAKNGQELLNFLSEKQPDIVILDINMPIMDGVQTLPLIKTHYPAIKIIILSMHNDPSIIVRMLELGADAYLTADCSSDELYEAITRCLKPGIFFSRTARKSPNPSLDMLDKKELQILQLLNSKTPLEKIAKQVEWSIQIVESKIIYLFRAARVTSVEELIKKAHQRGLIQS